MAPMRKCSNESCPPEIVLDNNVVVCHYCKCMIHLSCYGVEKKPEEIFVVANVVMLCNECIDTLKEDSSPKRKQPNPTSLIQRTLDVKNPILSLSKTSLNSTPPKTATVKQDQKMHAVIESLVLKLDDNTATIANLTKSVDSMKVVVTQQETVIASTIKANITSIKDTLHRTTTEPNSTTKKDTYANIIKRTYERHNETPKSSRQHRTPRTMKPVATGTSSKVIGKPPSPNTLQPATQRNNKSNRMPSREKAVWVSRLQRDTTEEDMNLYIKDTIGITSAEKYNVRRLVKKDRELSSYNYISFRVTCTTDIFETLLDSTNWPSYCFIREFEMEQKDSNGAQMHERAQRSPTVRDSGESSSLQSKNQVQQPLTGPPSPTQPVQ